MAFEEISRKVPVGQGEQCVAKVVGFGAKGDPVCKIKGFVIFLKLDGKQVVQMNDEVRVRITTVNEKHAFGELLSIKEPQQDDDEDDEEYDD
jgi:predicted RNA-binding protein with TRAM domain